MATTHDAPIRLTALRRELFKVFDHVIKTGQSAEIERNGHRLKIVLDEKKDKFQNLVKRDDVILCGDDELLSSPAKWSGEPLL